MPEAQFAARVQAVLAAGAAAKGQRQTVTPGVSIFFTHVLRLGAENTAGASAIVALLRSVHDVIELAPGCS